MSYFKFIIFITVIIIPTIVNTCEEDDLTGLQLIYNGMNGPNWIKNNNWLTNITCCDWYGVSCDIDSNVNQISLGYNNLSGNFPNFKNTLPYLNRIEMTYNSITGNLASLLNLKSLSIINLQQNKIKDYIPNQLLQSSILDYLNLSDNKLYGTIPEINCPTMRNLFLSDNQLTGDFPNIINSNFYTIDVSFNNLVTVSDTFNKAPILQTLVLRNNQISGTLPTSLINTNITRLDLNNNKFTGGIPREFSKIRTLNQFYANNNQLTSGINYLVWSNAIEIINNKFNETIGDLFAGNLRVFLARNNTFYGHLHLYCNMPTNIIDLTNNGDLKAYISYYEDSWCNVQVLEYPKYESQGYQCSNVMINNCLVLADASFFDYKYCN